MSVNASQTDYTSVKVCRDKPAMSKARQCINNSQSGKHRVKQRLFRSERDFGNEARVYPESNGTQRSCVDYIGPYSFLVFDLMILAPQRRRFYENDLSFLEKLSSLRDSTTESAYRPSIPFCLT